MAHILDRLRALMNERQAADAEMSRVQMEALTIKDQLTRELVGVGLSEGLVARLSFDDLAEISMVVVEPQWLPLRAEEIDFLERILATSTASGEWIGKATGILNIIRRFVPDAVRGHILDTAIMPPPPEGRGTDELKVNYVKD